MRTVLSGRGRMLFLALLAALVASTAAWAFWAGQSSGSASGRVGGLLAPRILSTTPGGGTVTLSWSAVSPPGSGTVSYYVRRDGGSASNACPSQTATGTQLSCTDTGVAVGSHSYTVTAVWHSWTARSENASAQVTSGAATHFALNAATSTPTAGAVDGLTIVAQDASNNTVTSYAGNRSLTFGGAAALGANHPTVSDGSGAAVAFGNSTTITFVGGIATVSGGTNGAMTLYKAETAKITVSDGTLSNGSGASVTVSPASAASFTVPTPSTQTAGTSFEVTLTALDAYGNTATGYAGTSKPVTFSGPTNSPNGKTPVYPGSVSFTAGVGTAKGITLYNASATTTLTAKEGSVSGSSGSFTVSPASAASFSVPTPSTQTAGTAFNLTLTAKDAFGNTATGYAGSMPIAFSGPLTSPGGDAPKYPASVVFTAGVGTASITIYDAGSTMLTAQEGSVAGTSGNFTVNGLSTTSKFLLSTPSPTVGSSFTEVIAATDTYGNTTTSFTGSHTLAFGGPSSTGPNGKAASYPSSVSFTAGEGKATITLYKAETTTLTAKQTTPALAGTSAGFTVIPGSAATFSLPTPSTQTVGIAFNETLTALDAGGNTATGYSGEKAVTFKGPQTSEGGEAPKYPASMSFTAGVGTASITLYDQTSGTTLEASQGGVKGVSGNFAVNTGTPVRLAWKPSGFNFNGQEEGTCYFTCTWTEIGRGRSWKAEVQVTDVGGNVVSNLGSGHTVSFSATVGSASPTSLTLPSTGTARTSTVTYTSSSSNSWSSDTFTAHSTGFTDATVLFKK